jgi:diacylglycerol O-acyltransferase / wax synthase
VIEYPQSAKPASELEAMRGAELIYFVIPEAALWSVVNIMAILDGPVDLDALKNRVMHAFLRFHRLQQRPVRKKKEFYWESVDSIDVEQHIRVVPESAAGTQEAIETLIGESLSTVLDHSRPLWELLYVPRYETGSAVILRIHHAYGDGRSLQAIATSILESSSEASLERREVSSATIRHKAVADAIRPPTGRRSKGPGKGWFQTWVRSLRKMAASFKKDHDTGFDAAPSPERMAAFSRAMSRTQLRQTSANLQCTLNDFVLSGIAGAIRENLLRSGKDPGLTRLTVTIPVDLHSPRSLMEMKKKGVLTNHLGTVTMQLPIGVADGAERARIVGRAMTEAIESREPLMQYKSLSSFHKMPQSLLVRMFRSQAHKMSGIVSNIAGPKGAYYLAGQRMRSWIFWVSAPQLAGAHLGVSVSHYMDEIRIGLSLPVNAPYDVRRLAAEMADQTEALMEKASAVSGD